ncbi:MAG: hypothetical protein V8T10_03985 [Merdibacter sp.]
MKKIRRSPKIQSNIAQLEEDIAAKEEEIAQWDAQIKERMVSEQATIGTNMYIDMIMGSKDLQEMMRTMEGLQRITESDEQQISSLAEEKAALDQQKSEQQRLEQDAIDQRAAGGRKTAGRRTAGEQRADDHDVSSAGGGAAVADAQRAGGSLHGQQQSGLDGYDR